MSNNFIINNLEHAIAVNLSESDIESNATLIAQLYVLCNDARLGQFMRNPLLTTSFPYVTAAVALINASGLSGGQKSALNAAIQTPQ